MNNEPPILVVIISPRQSVAIHQASLGYGAKNILIKPLVTKELLVIIRSLLGG